LADIRIITKG